MISKLYPKKTTKSSYEQRLTHIVKVYVALFFITFTLLLLNLLTGT